MELTANKLCGCPNSGITLDPREPGINTPSAASAAKETLRTQLFISYCVENRCFVIVRSALEVVDIVAIVIVEIEWANVLMV